MKKKKKKKIQKKRFVFQIIAFELGLINCHHLEQDISAAIIVLTNTFKISTKTIGEVFEINFPENDEKAW